MSKIKATKLNEGKVEIEDIELNELEPKEEGKIKKWFKKHKTGLAVGATAGIGAVTSVITYKLGYSNGLKAQINEVVEEIVEEVKEL
jgi:hypothetical protein